MNDYWYSDSRPVYPSWVGYGRRPAGVLVRLLVFAVVVIGVVGAVFWVGPHSFAGGGSDFADGSRPVPSSVPVPSSSSVPVPESDASVYLSTTSSGVPIRWSCDADIHVDLVGSAPEGAEQLLQEAVATLSGLSGLRLSATAGDENLITVRYQSTLPEKESPTAIGLGGPSSLSGGQIIHGAVWLKNTSPQNAPGNPYARQVLIHELMHALGIKHAPEGSMEIMAPVVPPGAPLDPGGYDIAALKAAGCPRG